MTIEPRFIQIHWLAGYPGALLNRDDTGLAKRLPFGGATRTRISSQCLKRHWRMAEDEHALQRVPSLALNDFGLRSRRIFSDEIAKRLIDEKKFSEDEVVAVVTQLRHRLFGKGDDEKAPKEKKGASTKSGLKALEFEQAFLLGRPEIDYLRDICRRVLEGDAELRASLLEKKDKRKGLTDFQKKVRKDLHENLKALSDSARVPRSVEAALFGRMVTSDLIANMDAAIHVAHAFTVHEEEPEQDYFTVVDDLKDETEDAGAAGVFDTELTSGLYYGYVVVDVPQLVSNLEGCERTKWLEADRALAGRVVEHLIHLIAKVSPGAKRGSTAPYAHAELVLAELGRRQPRTLANAFRAPVPLRENSVQGARSLLARAAGALDYYLGDMDSMHGPHESRLLAAVSEAVSGIKAVRAASVEATAGAAVSETAVSGIMTVPLPELAKTVNAAIVAGAA